MNIVSIFIGNELLNGHTSNANLLTLGNELKHAGYRLRASESLPDNVDIIADSVRRNEADNDVIIICGGLGPTVDDITRKAVALAVGAELDHSESVRKGLQAYMDKKGRTPSEEYYRRQSEIIDGAVILKNSIGLAPGLLIDRENTLIFLLPGPPREFGPMLISEVIPRVKEKKEPQSVSQLFHIFGVSESKVEDAFQQFLKKYPFVSPAYCANLGHVKLTLTFSSSHTHLQEDFSLAVAEIYGRDMTESGSLIDDIAAILEKENWTLGTAESCTGGWIGQAVTAYAGASSFFQGSVNTYANEWKMNLLGVKEETLNTVGAVSEECAGEMIKGLCERYSLDCGIAVTGIAGPGGGSEEKPVGTVYISTMTPKSVKVVRHQFGGSRREVREQTVRYALNQLRLQLIE